MNHEEMEISVINTKQSHTLGNFEKPRRHTICKNESDSSFNVNKLDINGLCERFVLVSMTSKPGIISELDDGKYDLSNAKNDIHTNTLDFDGHERDFDGDPDAASVYTPDEDGDTLLHMAIIVQNHELIMRFIDKTPTYSWLSFNNKLFQTPLHLAVLMRQTLVVRKLVTAGANITSRDKNGNTPLHIACREGMADIVRNLLLPVRYNEIEHNKYDIPFQRIPQDFTVVNYEGLTCVHLAASRGHLGIVKLLIDAGVDVNMKEGKTGRTILHNACMSGDLALVRSLIKLKSCDINTKTYAGLTPFDLARGHSQEAVCLVLAAAGAWFGDDAMDLE